MKKLLIAGATSAALAAMPLVATFAATEADVVDEIEVTVGSTCALARSAGEGSYSVSILTGQTAENFGNSTLAVNCSTSASSKTVTVKGEFSDLTSGENTISYAASATATPTADAGVWTAKAGSAFNNSTFVANNGNVLTGTGAQSTNVYYSVAAGSNQADGSYTGTAEYTLAVTD